MWKVQDRGVIFMDYERVEFIQDYHWGMKLEFLLHHGLPFWNLELLQLKHPLGSMGNWNYKSVQDFYDYISTMEEIKMCDCNLVSQRIRNIDCHLKKQAVYQQIILFWTLKIGFSSIVRNYILLKCIWKTFTDFNVSLFFKSLTADQSEEHLPVET